MMGGGLRERERERGEGTSNGTEDVPGGNDSKSNVARRRARVREERV